MSKMGRPFKTAEPKNTSLHLRITENEANRIKACAEKMGLNRTEAIMKGIERLEKEIEKK